MLRGIAGTASPGEIATGSFNLQPDHDGGSWLFLRVAGPPQGDAPGPAWDMVFDRQDRHGIFLQEPSGVEPVAALPSVSVRIDRTSKMGSPYSSTIRAGMLSVVGQSAFVTAHWGRGGRWTANLATGQVAEPNPPAGWMSFSKWSLVMDDGDEEITLVSYDAGQAS